jgi:hypothetical protein
VGSIPPESCHQDGDPPKSPFNIRQRLPSVGTISIYEFQGADMMETLLITLGVIAGAAIVFWLFVLEPRRKIYDRDD